MSEPFQELVIEGVLVPFPGLFTAPDTDPNDVAMIFSFAPDEFAMTFEQANDR
jgi:hypothetical protein